MKLFFIKMFFKSIFWTLKDLRNLLNFFHEKLQKYQIFYTLGVFVAQKIIFFREVQILWQNTGFCHILFLIPAWPLSIEFWQNKKFNTA